MSLHTFLKVFTAVMFVLTTLSIVLILAFNGTEPAPVSVAGEHSDALNKATGDKQGRAKASVIESSPSLSEPVLQSAVGEPLRATPADRRSEYRVESQQRCRQIAVQGIEDLQRRMRERIDIKEHRVLSAKRQSLRAMFEDC